VPLSTIGLCLLAAFLGALAGPRIAWAIRAWPGHEAFHCDYLHCAACAGGLRRRCYNAGSTQDRFYLVFSMVAAGASVWAFGPSTRALLSWVFSVSCLIITVVDMRFLIIPDLLSKNGVWVGLSYALLAHVWVVRLGNEPPAHYLTMTDSVLGVALGWGSLWILGWLAWVILKKEGMGGGDVKLLGAIGAWMGWQAVLGTIVLASFMGSIGGIGSILYRRIRFGTAYKPLSHMIPFGPYLCVGFLFIFYFGLDPLFQVLDLYSQWVLGPNHP
jgi:leader peptidase (prepilin peptidase) / N-methyltransferase